MTSGTGLGLHRLVDVTVDVRERIGRIPRVSLGEFPTPITPCPRFSALFGGPEIFVKREDLSGLGLGGNKSRLLEFRLAEALNLGADVVVAGLDVQSNSARQLAAAANRLGMKTHLLLRGEQPSVVQGNLLVDQILGATITFAPVSQEDMDTLLQETAREYRLSGHTPYVMNHARFFGIGASLAGLEWTLESCEQLHAHYGAPTHFYLSSGGKCQSGMIIASLLLDQPFAIVGQNAHPDAPNAIETTLRIAADTIEALHLDVTVSADMVDNRTPHAGSAFGVPTTEGIEAIKLLARAEGIILDPVFSGKAMAGLIADIRAGYVTSQHRVVFVHTGGIPAIFTHADQLREEIAH